MRIASRVLAAAALATAAASCGSVVRTSSAPVFLVIDKLQGIRGATQPGAPGVPLVSDVITNVTSPDPCTTVNPCPTIFGDSGLATLRLSLKDIGPAGSTSGPSPNNEVTITRVHVSYTRTDGRNQEGVDVPYGFDTASTITVPSAGTADLPFILVRSAAKDEAPLVGLKSNGVVISAIGLVTIYGQDRVGNAISATGTIAIEFANFGDK